MWLNYLKLMFYTFEFNPDMITLPLLTLKLYTFDTNPGKITLVYTRVLHFWDSPWCPAPLSDSRAGSGIVESRLLFQLLSAAC